MWCADADATEIANLSGDVKWQSPGELPGQEQSGLPRFRFGDLANDLELIELARKLAPET